MGMVVMGIQKGDVILSSARPAYLAPGGGVEIYSSKGHPRGLYQVTSVHTPECQLKLGPMPWLERVWFYLRHPHWWAFALDIPFRPPDR